MKVCAPCLMHERGVHKSLCWRYVNGRKVAMRALLASHVSERQIRCRVQNAVREGLEIRPDNVSESAGDLLKTTTQLDLFTKYEPKEA